MPSRKTSSSAAVGLCAMFRLLSDLGLHLPVIRLDERGGAADDPVLQSSDLRFNNRRPFAVAEKRANINTGAWKTATRTRTARAARPTTSGRQCVGGTDHRSLAGCSFVIGGESSKGDGGAASNPRIPEMTGSDASATELVRVGGNEEASLKDFVAIVFDQPTLIPGHRLRTPSRIGARLTNHHALPRRGAEWLSTKRRYHARG